MADDVVRVAVLVPNLFLRVPVESAIRGVGAAPVGMTPGGEPPPGCVAAVVDLDAVRDTVAAVVRRLVSQRVVVLAFGPHVDAARLAAARQAGAVALPRGVFLERLPELLGSVLAG